MNNITAMSVNMLAMLNLHQNEYNHFKIAIVNTRTCRRIYFRSKTMGRDLCSNEVAQTPIRTTKNLKEDDEMSREKP